MDLEFESVMDYGLYDTARVLDEGFSDYVVPVAISEEALFLLLRFDGVDTHSSRVILLDGEAVGAALIARRGWSSRLAGMAIVPDARGLGVGHHLMTQMLQEARERGERLMELEVIEQNEPALRLYEKCGFRVHRRLVGYAGAPTGEPLEEALEEVDLRELARLVVSHGLPDLPWQISGASLVQLNPPNRAFRLKEAYVGTSNPKGEQLFLRSILVKPEARGQGQAGRLLRALMTHYPEKEWRVPTVCPEEIGGLFETLGLQKEEITQLQMRAALI
jgi:ribosomal protein S18 acetylase RimI-like enzyme